MLRKLLGVIAFACLAVSAQAQPAQVLTAWIQTTAQGDEIRAVVSGACPDAIVDGRALPLKTRTAASADFPAVCSLALPKQVQSVSVGGQALPPPARAVRRIVIMGDTGCKIEGQAIQACNDPKAWPFAEVSRLAAAKKPDLVIHVGDYYYRQTPCPLGMAGCAGSPYGDRWDTWAAEFFTPAEPLLKVAPWVFARGNHETCKLAGYGWYRLLDSGPAPEGCPAVSGPFVIKAGDLNLFVMDSADASDQVTNRGGIAAFARQLDSLGAALDSGQGWIVTHKPIWALVPIARVGPIGPLEVGINATEQRAVKGRALGGVQMIVSGHIHHFSSVTFGPERPAQLVVGTGGDVGLPADKPQVYGGKDYLDGMDAQTFSFSRYGYYLMEKDGEDWTGVFHDAADVVRANCRLHERALTCQEP